MSQMAPKLARNASAAVILPIAGLVVGLALGGLRAWFLRRDEFAQIACVLKWGVTGFFAGLALVVLVALQTRRPNQVSIRQMMVLVVVSGLLAWFFGRVLFGAIGYEGF